MGFELDNGSHAERPGYVYPMVLEPLSHIKKTKGFYNIV